MTEIRKLNAADTAQAKRLWEISFGDSEAFINNYFENKFKLTDSLAYFEDDILAGDITMQKMKMRLCGNIYNIGFLAGCATHPDFRYRGVMKELIRIQLDIMRKQGICICCLHPFLHSFYRKFGFETISHMKIYSVNINNNTFKNANFDEYTLLEKYKEYTNEFESVFVRDINSCKNKLEELKCDGGKIYFNGDIYALYYVNDDDIEVIEHNIYSEDQLNVFLKNIPEKGKIKIPLPNYFKEGETEEFTMMRITDLKAFLENIRCGDCKISFAVKDDFCPWNKGTYLFESKNGKNTVEFSKDISEDTENIYDIRDFTKMIFDTNIEKYCFCGQNALFFDTY